MRWIVLAVALLLPQGDSLKDAVNLGRTRDQAMYNAFHAGYKLAASGDVDSAEIITEFRRAVMIARQHVEGGEYTFNENGLATELAPFRGLVTFIAQVRLNPLNTFVNPPPYDMYIRTGPTTGPAVHASFKRDPVYPPGMGPPGSNIVGVRLEATFSRADIASAPDPYLMITDDRGNVLWQGRVDLTRYR
jgi:hypothetical protein